MDLSRDYLRIYQKYFSWIERELDEEIDMNMRNMNS